MIHFQKQYHYLSYHCQSAYFIIFVIKEMMIPVISSSNNLWWECIKSQKYVMVGILIRLSLKKYRIVCYICAFCKYIWIRAMLNFKLSFTVNFPHEHHLSKKTSLMLISQLHLYILIKCQYLSHQHFNQKPKKMIYSKCSVTLKNIYSMDLMIFYARYIIVKQISSKIKKG